jgi:hypothetical protein
MFLLTFLTTQSIVIPGRRSEMETKFLTIPEIQPVVVQRPSGGWLARSPAGAALRIGVIGETEAAAREQFAASVDRCRKLLTDAAP